MFTYIYAFHGAASLHSFFWAPPRGRFREYVHSFDFFRAIVFVEKESKREKIGRVLQAVLRQSEWMSPADAWWQTLTVACGPCPHCCPHCCSCIMTWLWIMTLSHCAVCFFFDPFRERNAESRKQQLSRCLAAELSFWIARKVLYNLTDDCILILKSTVLQFVAPVSWRCSNIYCKSFRVGNISENHVS